MLKAFAFVLLMLTVPTQAKPRRYATPYQGPVVAQGQSQTNSGSGRHEVNGRFSWGANSTTQTERGYQHQTDGSYYRDRETRTSNGYYRSPYGNGDSRTVDTSGSDRFYDHNGEPSRVLSMYRAEYHLRVQRLFEKADSMKSSMQQTADNIAKSRSILPTIRHKITAAEYQGFVDACNRAEAELNSYRATLASINRELATLRR